VVNTSLGVTYSTLTGAFCVTLPTYGMATLGWPAVLGPATPVPLAAGYSYTFAYTAWSTQALYSFNAKVGHSVSPYTAAFSTFLDDPDVTPTLFTHDFVTSYGDTGAGVAFVIEAYSATTICFDNVVLVRH
jgi:hypothetical protein